MVNKSVAVALEAAASNGEHRNIAHFPRLHLSIFNLGLRRHHIGYNQRKSRSYASIRVYRMKYTLNMYRSLCTVEVDIMDYMQACDHSLRHFVRFWRRKMRSKCRLSTISWGYLYGIRHLLANQRHKKPSVTIHIAFVYCPQQWMGVEILRLSLPKSDTSEPLTIMSVSIHITYRFHLVFTCCCYRILCRNVCRDCFGDKCESLNRCCRVWKIVS